MTDDELLAIDPARQPAVTVTANDYSYDGWLVAVFAKHRNFPQQIRCVVEDDNGRCFIHNARQVTTR